MVAGLCNCVTTPALIIHSDTSSVVSSSRGKEALLAGCLVLHSGKLYYTVVWEQPLLLIVADILWKYLSPEIFWSVSGSEECFADVVSGIKRRNWTRHQQASKQSLDQWCAAMSAPHCAQRRLFHIFITCLYAKIIVAGWLEGSLLPNQTVRFDFCGQVSQFYIHLPFLNTRHSVLLYSQFWKSWYVNSTRRALWYFANSRWQL